ncbi:MAG: zinc-ribbon domain containing protein [Deltaproteobacteria bacterium]|nr:zinc-ribbon domain containing protein [Deltaproteobacteria bacterium]
MNSNADKWRVYEGHCKDCGEPFTFSESAYQFDQLRRLSKPSRCPKCRTALASFINSSGTRFWEPPARQVIELKDRAKLGLMKVVSNPASVALVDFPAHPNPEVKAKFQLLDPVVERIISNLEYPQGTKVSILVGPTGTGKSV